MDHSETHLLFLPPFLSPSLPQVVAGTVRDWRAADVWSLGVCLYNMLTGMAIYSDPQDEAYHLLCTPGGVERVLRHHILTYRVQLPAVAAHLIAAMLSPDPRDRLTLEDVLSHPWLVEGEEAFIWGSRHGREGEGQQERVA